MKAQRVVYNPNALYANIDFERIKSNIMTIYSDAIDYGSLIIIESGKHYIAVNNLGKIEVFVNSGDLQYKSIINDVKDIFKSQVKSFELVS